MARNPPPDQRGARYRSPPGAATDQSLAGIATTLQSMNATLAQNLSSLTYARAVMNSGANTFAALLNTASPGPLVTPVRQTAVIILPETNQLRFRTDGQSPDANVGMPIAPGQAWADPGRNAGAAAINPVRLTVFTAGPTTINLIFLG